MARGGQSSLSRDGGPRARLQVRHLRRHLRRTPNITLAESVTALWKLTKSGISGLGRRERGVVSEISEKIKWTAGYVVAWVEDEGFKRQSRKRVLDAVRRAPARRHPRAQPGLARHLQCLHPPGRPGGRCPQAPGQGEVRHLRIPDRQSIRHQQPHQWPHPAAGRRLLASSLQCSRRRFHRPIRLWMPPISGRRTRPSTTRASATTPPKAISVIAPLSRTSGDRSARKRSGPGRSGSAPTLKARSALAPDRKRQKALLIGINDYPDPAQRLEGCVNDVFTMSSVLQDCGVPPEAIRTCLDSRATAEGILDRMQWLLDDPKPSDELVFYYSGHGARIPEYGESFEPDHHVESLVPWDFDWSRGKAISDDQIFSLYSQLPYDCRLVMIFDCCHSGGIHRDGGMRPRGITPPGRHPPSRAEVGQQDPDVGQPRLHPHQPQVHQQEGRGGQIFRQGRRHDPIGPGLDAAQPPIAPVHPSETGQRDTGAGTLSARHHRSLRRGGVLL